MTRVQVAAAGVVALGLAVAVWGVSSWWSDRQWKDRYVDAVNAAAAADSARQVYIDSLESELAIWQRRVFVARDERDLAARELAEERRLREEQGMTLTAIYSAYVDLRDQHIEGTTRPELVGADTTRFHLAGESGPVRVNADVFVATAIPDTTPAWWTLDAILAPLTVRLRQLEDESGVPFIECTIPTASVERCDVDAAQLLERTGIATDEGPSRAKWAAIGGGVAAGILAIIDAIFGS